VFDVFLTDGVLLYARHLQEGKIDPGRIEATWNYSRFSLAPAEIARRVQAAVDEGELAARLQGYKLPLRAYDLFKQELARYRDLDARYRFQPVPADTVLRPGMSHPNVIALRTQLQRLGYTLDSVEPQRFDESLANVVKDFQYLHTLAADGVVGSDTFAALNVPYADRVEQLRINLERLRWISRDIADRMVVVNIAGFELYYFQDQGLAWETNVMVGQIKHQTPLFRDNMSYLEFNPTWTVPQSIIRRSLYPKLSTDPGYAAENNYKLYDRDGAEVDPYSIDWGANSRGWFPYRVVQQPGPDNALGRVKFMFPNRYAIYLHDTPAQALFSRTSRAFSAGCIRVEDPLFFAELLLQTENGWDRERIDAAVASARQQVVRFSTPIDIMLMYWTASPTPDGRVQLHPDIYDKDAEALALLNAAPVWDQL
jgi:murein L,D-transpeptidase YcbB/YkuD